MSNDFTAAPGHKRPGPVGTASPLQSGAATSSPLVILRCGDCGVMLQRDGVWVSCPECGAFYGMTETLGDLPPSPQLERARELARPYFAEVGQSSPEPTGLRRLSRWAWRHTAGRGHGRPAPLDSFARGLE